MSGWEVIFDCDRGDDPQLSDVREGDRVVTIAVMEGTPETGQSLMARIIRIERPIA